MLSMDVGEEGKLHTLRVILFTSLLHRIRRIPFSFSQTGDGKKSEPKSSDETAMEVDTEAAGKRVAGTLFDKKTRAIVWGLQTRAVQGMMDFDYVCQREQVKLCLGLARK